MASCNTKECHAHLLEQSKISLLRGQRNEPFPLFLCLGCGAKVFFGWPPKLHWEALVRVAARAPQLFQRWGRRLGRHRRCSDHGRIDDDGILQTAPKPNRSCN
jgi:hypothetical protein